MRTRYFQHKKTSGVAWMGCLGTETIGLISKNTKQLGLRLCIEDQPSSFSKLPESENSSIAIYITWVKKYI
jgi:hypothetical protein